MGKSATLGVLVVLFTGGAPAVGGDLALGVASDKKHSAVLDFIMITGTSLDVVEASDFGLPEGPAFRYDMKVGRNYEIPVTFLFTRSGRNNSQNVDELRVAVGQQRDFSGIEPVAAGGDSSWLEGPCPKGACFDNIRFSFTQDNREYPVIVRAVLAGAKAMVRPRIVFYQVIGVRAGEVELDGKMVKVLVVDRNQNGLFDDQVSCASRGGLGDVLLIDADGNGKFRLRCTSYGDFGCEGFPVTPLARIGGSYYECKLHPTGESLSLTPTKPRLGIIRADKEILAAGLVGTSYVDAPVGMGEAVKVPKGEYLVLRSVEQREDQAGHKWTLEASCVRSRAKALAVRAEETVSIPRTEQVIIGCRVYSTGGAGRWRVRGEFYTNEGLRIRGIGVDDKNPKKPVYEIRDAEGRIVASGELEYG